MVSRQSKQASKHTHARVQWSHARVGLAQTHPNHYLDGRALWYCTL